MQIFSDLAFSLLDDCGSFPFFAYPSAACLAHDVFRVVCVAQDVSFGDCCYPLLVLPGRLVFVFSDVCCGNERCSCGGWIFQFRAFSDELLDCLSDTSESRACFGVCAFHCCLPCLFARVGLFASQESDTVALGSCVGLEREGGGGRLPLAVSGFWLGAEVLL